MSKNRSSMITSLKNSIGELTELVKGVFETLSVQNEAFLQTADVAGLLNMSERSVQRYAQRGIIKCKTIGGTNFYLKSDVFAILKSR